MGVVDLAPHAPYRRALEYVGIVILLIGIILIALGILDVTWTTFYYLSSNDRCPETWPDFLEDPCDNNQLVWTWVAPGIWGGVFLVIVGAVGFGIHCQGKNIKSYITTYSVGCFLLMFPVCPAIIAVVILQMYYQTDIFHYMSEGNIEYQDDAKFIVPLALGGLAFIAWILSIAVTIIACWVNTSKAIIQSSRGGKSKLTYFVTAPQEQKQPVMVQQQPVVMQQQQPQYEIVQIPQPAPPPYWIGPYPIGAPPPMFGPRGPPFPGPRLPALMPPPGPYM